MGRMLKGSLKLIKDAKKRNKVVEDNNPEEEEKVEVEEREEKMVQPWISRTNQLRLHHRRPDDHEQFLGKGHRARRAESQFPSVRREPVG